MRDVRVVRSDSTRRVVWVVATASGTPEIPRRTRVALEGSPHGPGTVRRSERTANGNDVYLELSGVLSSAPRDGMPAAADKAWIGHELTLVRDPGRARRPTSPAGRGRRGWECAATTTPQSSVRTHQVTPPAVSGAS